MSGRVRSLLPGSILLLVVLVTTVWALFPLHEPQLPGILHLGVIGGEDPPVLDRSFRPLVSFLGRSVRRSGVVQVLTAEEIDGGEHGADLLLVPPGRIQRDGYEVLAWTKPVGRVGVRTELVLVRRRGTVGEPLRLGLGDRDVLGGPAAGVRRLREGGMTVGDEATVGTSPYCHDEMIAAFAHGAVDAIVVRRTDLDRALGAGLLEGETLRIESLGEASPRFALVAGPSLSEPARRELRSRALTLDHLRLNPNHGQAKAVALSLAHVGIGGFAPLEPFPNLRP
ncbi:MAG TPA: hypothetical protein VKA86_04815 [Candidatus Krumholzibacteria bacterium]|nr:hypothetical protein [Candidatus Krumholzibacteria bacterium]